MKFVCRQLQDIDEHIKNLQKKKAKLLEAEKKKKDKDVERKYKSIIKMFGEADPDIDWKDDDIGIGGEDILYRIRKIIEVHESPSAEQYHLVELFNGAISQAQNDIDRQKKILDGLKKVSSEIEKEWK